MDPLEDPDYTLIVRAQDLRGVSETALSGNTRVHIVMQQNLWINPGPLTVKEHLREMYPLVLAKVRWNAQSSISTTVYPVTDHCTLASFLPF